MQALSLARLKLALILYFLPPKYYTIQPNSQNEKNVLFWKFNVLLCKLL